MKRIPVAAVKIPLCVFKKVFSGKGNNSREEFTENIAILTGKKHIVSFNSGLASFYVILEALKETSSRKEVILPAYTAGSLVVAIKKAGLKPVLCDINKDNFNVDVNKLEKIVSKDTLCILSIHMFGIPDDNILKLKDRFPDVFIIEDCAQSLGSKIEGTPVGKFGDISFFSFNRGKNITSYGGGCIATDIEKIKDVIQNKYNTGKEPSIIKKILLPFKMMALSVACRPLIYGLGYPIIAQFKENKPPEDFNVTRYTEFQASVALWFLGHIDEASSGRNNNGIEIINGLKGLKGIILPEVNDSIYAVFNRLPIIVEDIDKMQIIKKHLWIAGVESSQMYLRPLHHIFDLGYSKEDFPNACYLADRLLTLPVHSLLKKKDVDKIIKTIKEVLK